MTKKRFTSEVFDDGLFRIEKITDNAEVVCYKETDDVVDVLNELNDDNESLKQQVTYLTMYKNLFKEFQKQLDGVKSKSDLDHKDFEDLIELSKGHVFDDNLGWIRLPVK